MNIEIFVVNAASGQCSAAIFQHVEIDYTLTIYSVDEIFNVEVKIKEGLKLLNTNYLLRLGYFPIFIEFLKSFVVNIWLIKIPIITPQRINGEEAFANILRQSSNTPHPHPLSTIKKFYPRFQLIFQSIDFLSQGYSVGLAVSYLYKILCNNCVC